VPLAPSSFISYGKEAKPHTKSLKQPCLSRKSQLQHIRYAKDRVYYEQIIHRLQDNTQIESTLLSPFLVMCPTTKLHHHLPRGDQNCHNATASQNPCAPDESHILQSTHHAEPLTVGCFITHNSSCVAHTGCKQQHLASEINTRLGRAQHLPSIKLTHSHG